MVIFNQYTVRFSFWTARYSVARSTWETDDAISDPELLIKHFYQAVKKEKGVEFDLAVKEPILLKEAVKVGWW